ncbi:MAG: T9SS type A sorting domain-containing protein [Flavobacteriales bacterium]|nr:T9SS type A sorting domain-containing protein [Flavobacteriales bacterium]
MKKLLLSFLSMTVLFTSYGQVVFSVEAPVGISGGYGHTYADVNSGWGSPDMTDPLNAVIDTVMLADDGTAADSLACNALVNDLTGKVAMLYRGDCEFGTKALNCENAGAVAVIIVNNGGAPISMGGGADGANVTIPVFMISTNDGAILRNVLDTGGDLVVFLGSKTGYYDDDLGMVKQGCTSAQQYSTVSALAQDDTEFDVVISSWVYNYGNNDQSGITVTADVSYGGSSVYSNTSAAQSILSGDSLLFTFPNFSQTTYGTGEYTITYTIDMGVVVDEYTNDNSYVVNFLIDDNVMSYVPIDASTNEPLNSSGIRPGGTLVSQFESCIAFMDPNASRLAVTGIQFNASTYDPDATTTLVGKFVEAKVYEWNDVFTDMTDVAFASPFVSDYEEIGLAEYSYDTDDQGMTVVAQLNDTVVLVDNQRYLFCVVTYDSDVYFGHDNAVGYDENLNNYLQPVMMTFDGTSWYTGWSDPTYPTIAIHTMDADTFIEMGVEENEVELTAYPNPTSDVITIPLTGLKGNAELFVTDMTGKMVMTTNVNMTGGNLQVDVTELPAGYYTFTMNFEDGRVSNFNVAVTK